MFPSTLEELLRVARYDEFKDLRGYPDPL